tara:strand:- start:868 stop:1110 length:243 start_codon:yes stop_codon:yes gene_type:complete
MFYHIFFLDIYIIILIFKVNDKTEKVMDEQKTINSLLGMLQKRNNDIINLELQVAQLTDKLNAATQKEESDNDKTKEQDI